MMSLLCETQPTSVLWVCSYLNNKERFKIGVCSKDLFDLLNPLFQSIAYEDFCHKKFLSIACTFEKFRMENPTKSDQISALMKNVDVAHSDSAFSNFWKKTNEERLTTYNPYLLNFEAVKIFYTEDNRLEALLKQLKADNTELALRRAAAGNFDSIHAFDFDLLCRNVKNINAPTPNNGNTALHWAVKAQNEMFVEKLLMHNACCNQTNKLKQTPLHLAAALSSVKIVSLLVLSEADYYLRDNNGDTVVDIIRNNKIMFNAFHL